MVYSDASGFFDTGGMLYTYKVTTPLQVQRKFKNAEKISKALWDRRSHQNDETGENDEGELPCFARDFFEYFEFLKERGTTNNTARVNCQRNMRVNCSVIGQQATLSTEDTNIISSTAAAPGRVRGTGEIAGEVTINEFFQGGDSEDNTTTSEGQNNRVKAAMFPTPFFAK